MASGRVDQPYQRYASQLLLIALKDHLLVSQPSLTSGARSSRRDRTVAAREYCCCPARTSPQNRKRRHRELRSTHWRFVANEVYIVCATTTNCGVEI
jgi:hypothetical protein